MRVMNMQAICSNDARIMIYDSKNKAGCRDTYSVLWCVRKLAFDPNHLCEPPGRDWDWSKLLKLPLSMILISHFFVYFSSFVLLLSAASKPCFVACGLLMYGTMC